MRRLTRFRNDRSRSCRGAISPELRRPGDLLTLADVCQLLYHSRDESAQCGVEHDRAPELVKVEWRSERVYRVAWSLSDAAGGRLKRLRQ